MILFSGVFLGMLCLTPYFTYLNSIEDNTYINEWDVVEDNPPDFTHGHYL